MGKGKRITGILVCLFVLCFILCFSGCAPKEEVRTDGYEYVIGVSLTNVVEPWLNNLVQVISAKVEDGKDVNLIFRDAAGSADKQIDCLLYTSPSPRD